MIALHDAGFAERDSRPVQDEVRPAGDSIARFGAGLAPMDAPRVGPPGPMFHYPYAPSRIALAALMADAVDPAHGARMRYVDPTTGGWAMPTLGTWLTGPARGIPRPGGAVDRCDRLLLRRRRGRHPHRRARVRVRSARRVRDPVLGAARLARGRRVRAFLLLGPAGAAGDGVPEGKSSSTTERRSNGRLMQPVALGRDSDRGRVAMRLSAMESAAPVPPVVDPSVPLQFLVNGSPTDAATQAKLALIRDVLESHGRTGDLQACLPAELAHAAREAASRALATRTAVIAVGGDGTLNTVAQAAHAAGCAMGVVAHGTFNYFARTHGLPDDPVDAVRVLLHSRPRAGAGRRGERSRVPGQREPRPLSRAARGPRGVQGALRPQSRGRDRGGVHDAAPRAAVACASAWNGAVRSARCAR